MSCHAWLFGTRPMETTVARSADLAEVLAAAPAEGFDCLRLTLRAEAAGADLTAHGFRLAEKSEQRALWEKRLTPDCPLLPVRMHPAFRHGKSTPWGGERLRTDWGKPIPEAPTGESLEISAVPGLESTDDTGVRLTELIRSYGVPFAGRFAQGKFPLLLKLIDAQQPLSVQVHPNDAYAAEHERGSLGKTEAWLILQAEENSRLVWGIEPGTTREQLRDASRAGAAVGGLLRRVAVRPGDVCNIPAGCVHAIDSGIVLYEIQQSSEVTYRFYDWDRVDAQGRGRELHLDKAMDVTDLSFAPAPIHAPEAPLARVLDEPYFSLDLLAPRGEAVALPVLRDFGFLTALTEGLTLRWADVELPLQKGESFYLPASAPALTLVGTGRAALSMPGEAAKP